MITTDRDTLATSRRGVFAGGDCTLGPASFVEAVAHGRQAAESIRSFLEYGGLKEVKLKERPMDPEVTAEERLRAKPIQRQPMPHLAVEKRRSNFDPVDLGLSVEMAQAEGQRCLTAVCAAAAENVSGNADLRPST